MRNPKIFCMCLHDHHLKNLKKLNYIPVGLGQNKFSSEWIKDNTSTNISKKNSFYGEYSFYYWLWKNLLETIDDNTWIGFTGYRYHWSQLNNIHSDNLNKIINKNNFESIILKDIPNEWNDAEVVLGQKIQVNNWKLSKIIKHAKKKFFLSPSNFLKSRQNIKLQFDVFHGEGLLDKAISVLDVSERDDFRGPRENVGMSTFGDILGFAGMAASGIGAVGAGLGMFSSATGTGAAWSAAGASLSGLSKSFYPRGY